ncbi:apiosidase-like domain-containing protein [Lactobacillus jensenii]|uniref:apiosidase-like domain-containing protein n=1 Tax=Lactobacillus jensenii TaxID=109790 RepID=UPI002870400A|nr:DUF4038 domain-containing protein [Lactobacillus jensenii]
MLTVNGKYLYKDGQRFFYLADTCWSAFTNLTLPDWKFYLDTRKAQGYTAIQINLLRQYDSSENLLRLSNMMMVVMNMIFQR